MTDLRTGPWSDRETRPVYRRIYRFEEQLLVELFRAIRIALYAEAKS